MVNADRKRRPIVTDQSHDERPPGVSVEQWDRHKRAKKAAAKKEGKNWFNAANRQRSKHPDGRTTEQQNRSKYPPAPAQSTTKRYGQHGGGDGERGGGFIVLDVDPHNGGNESLAAIEKTKGNLPAMPEAIGADGSRYLFFSRPVDLLTDGNYQPIRGASLLATPEQRRPAPGFLLKLGASELVQYPIGRGLTVHDSGPPSTWEIYHETRSIARAWACSHDQRPTTGGNFELLAMNVIHFEKAMYRVLKAREILPEEWPTLTDDLSVELLRVFGSVEAFFSVSMGFEEFLQLWHDGGFPRLEVGHKLAAALCCTDVPPEIEIRAPWPAWSLLVPDGLFEELGISRLWCIGSDWIGAVGKDGTAFAAPKAGEALAVASMIRNLIRGACLSIANPDEHRKKGAHGGASSSKNHRHGPPDLAQARFLLAAPVAIDLREHVAGVSSGRVSTAPKVQFLVRGHWREQVHGAARSLRKRIWIQPFWKGPEGARVLLRSHTLKGDDA